MLHVKQSCQQKLIKPTERELMNESQPAQLIVFIIDHNLLRIMISGFLNSLNIMNNNIEESSKSELIG